MKIHSLRGIFSPVAAFLGLILFLSGAMVHGAGPGWYNNFDQAMQVARQQGRPLFVDFSTSWCSVCKQMDRTTLVDPAVLGRLENFVKVKVDGDAFPQLCQAYGVEAYPTFIHMDHQGRVLEKRVGGMRVQEMAGALDNTLRKVSTSMAIAQAQQQAESQRRGAQSAPAADAPPRAEIASADLKISGRDAITQTRAVTREAADRGGDSRGGAPAGGPSMYNMTNNQLQGSGVYATDQANSGRRSRFGGSDSLKDLAEATAQPQDAASGDSPSSREKASAKENSLSAERNDVPAPAESRETATADKKAPSVATSSRDNGRSSAAAEPAAPVPTAATAVVESRLAGISSDQLPRPLLSRSASGTTQNMNAVSNSVSPEVRAVAVSNDSAPAMTAQRNDKGDPSTQLPAKPVEIASASPVKASGGTDEPRAASDKPRDTEKAGKEKAAAVEKTSEGATRSDIERWMKDADTKLVEAHKANSSQRKREARAMYNKVVEKDPENKFGKSDMAYVKMVSLIVDKDSDLLRRQAYTKIKEFETRFPNSSHKDYYTLIRAVLATDLGETNEAHKLLSNFSDEFPDSKYAKMAEETRKGLPPVKKESASKAKSSSTGSKSAASSSKSKSSSSRSRSSNS